MRPLTFRYCREVIVDNCQCRGNATNAVKCFVHFPSSILEMEVNASVVTKDKNIATALWCIYYIGIKHN